VGQLGPVADRFLDDDRVQAQRARVDGGRAHTAAGGAAGDQQRVHLARHQPRGEIGAEEAGCVLLDQQHLARPAVEALIQLDPLGAFDQPAVRRDLADPDAGFL
jgi:hypothetical protein